MLSQNNEFKLVDTIILNGIVDYCETGDEADEIIGVKSLQTVKRLNGECETIMGNEFPFSKKMEAKCHWDDYYASIQMLTGDTPIDLDHIDETKIVSMEGEIDSRYYHRYSDYTGYLWTEEGFICGGHNIPQMLASFKGQYIHMEIELYKKLY